MIDPTAEDPWDFLFFDSMTGMLVGRFDQNINSPNAKGAHTTDSKTLPLNIEAVTEGRLRTRRNLVRAIDSFYTSLSAGISVDRATSELINSFADNDNYGLSDWYILKDGSTEQPFRKLRAQYPEIWRELSASVSGSR